MVLGQVFTPKAIKVQLESEDKDEVFEELVEEYVSVHPDADRGKILTAVRERESKMSTGIMPGIAVPHCRTDAVSGVHGVIGISRRGIEYDSLDNTPVHLLFLVLSSPDASAFHLRVLKRLAQILENPSFYRTVVEQTNPDSVYDVICKYEDELSSSM